MKNKKSVNAVLLILLVIALCAAGVFGYMWYKEKNINCPKCEETKINDSSDDKNNDKVETKKVSVADAVNTISQYFGTYNGNKIKIVIPKIIGGGDNSEKLNKKILDNVVSKIILPIEECDTDQNPKGCENGSVADINVKYKSLIKNGYS